MTGRLESYISDTASIGDPSDLFGYFEDFVSGYGFDITCYIILREALQTVELEKGLIYHSFPPDWADRYFDQNYYDIDPVINAAPTQSQPYLWSDIHDLIILTQEQVDYLKDWAQVGYPSGLSVPVHTAKGRIAYFGLGSKSADLKISRSQMAELQYICQHTHLRYIELGGLEKPETVILSPREKEVLYWIAQGKSNSVIASILEISDHTVDTLVRRCFQKLGVTSRVSAALRGVCAGLVAT